jgi:glutaredoxin
MPRRLKQFLICFGLCGLIVVAVTGRAEMYKWTDADGAVHYTDTPPPDNRPTIEIKGTISSYTSAEIVSMSDGAAPAKTKNKSVIMYAASWCGVCKTAKKYFKQQGISYQEYDIETSEQGKRGFAKLNGKGVPIILVGNQRLNGFNPGHFQQIYRSP